MRFNNFTDALANAESAIELACFFKDKELPREIGRLRNLETLRLMNAQQLRSLPKEIGELRSLKHLDVRPTTKMQTLPEEIGKLESLETLIWRGKGGSGLPASLARLPNLRELTIGAGLSAIDGDALPPGLESLDLSSNNLTELPASLARLARLRSLDASGNKLTAVPDWLSDLAELRELRLDANKLGGIPAGLGTLAHLRVLGVSGSAKIKALPAGFPALEELKANRTGMRAFPESLTECRSLRTISLRECRLTGALPDSIGNLQELEALWVDNNYQHPNRNQLTAVPASLFTLPKLVILDLRFNPIAALPRELGTLPKLGFLGLPDDQRMPAEEADRAAKAYPTAYIGRGFIDWSELDKMSQAVRDLVRE